MILSETKYDVPSVTDIFLPDTLCVIAILANETTF